MANVKIEIEGLDEFMKKLSKKGDTEFKREVATWLDASGFQLLEEIQRMIIAMQVVDTRRLLNSFTKGKDGNVWTISNGGLTLEIGTNVEYAKFVNDGHWANPRGVDKRFVPGKWENGKFTYIRGHKSGMVLKQQWIEGRPYWDNALVIFEKMFEQSFKNKLRDWVSKF